MEPESDTASLVAVRVSVAKMEGMLTQALSDHGTRISNTEAEVVKIHGRLSEKGKLLATHTEQINSNRDRIEDLEEANDASVARLIAVGGVVVAAASFVFQFLPFGKG